MKRLPLAPIAAIKLLMRQERHSDWLHAIMVLDTMETKGHWLKRVIKHAKEKAAKANPHAKRGE